MSGRKTNQLYQKTGIAVNLLAMSLLSKKVGERVPTIAEYQEEFQVSRGTIQNAYQHLKDSGAIQIQSHGHLGSFLAGIDYGLLQSYCIQRDLLGVMPLPYSTRYEGFANAIYEELSLYQFNMAYARGAIGRINLVESGSYQFAVCSQYAAEEAIGSGKNIEIVLGFGSHSFLSQHVLLLRDKSKDGIEDGMRVAYDPSSMDQSHLTQEVAAGKQIELVDLRIQYTISQLRENQIDAGIWNYDALDKNQDEFKVIYLDKTENAESLSTAVIVIQKGNQPLKELLLTAIDAERVRQSVDAVVTGRKKPNY